MYPNFQNIIIIHLFLRSTSDNGKEAETPTGGAVGVCTD